MLNENRPVALLLLKIITSNNNSSSSRTVAIMQRGQCPKQRFHRVPSWYFPVGIISSVEGNKTPFIRLARRDKLFAAPMQSYGPCESSQSL